MFNASEYMNGYLHKVQNTIQNLKISQMEKILVRVIHTIDTEKTIYLVGNGGSMATASHLACDLNYVAGRMLYKKIKAVALDSLPTIMAIGNDDGFEKVFEQQLIPLLKPGDLVIAFSGSGNSMNTLRAILFAKRNGGYTIGISGYDGGQLSVISDLCLHVDCHDMQVVEDCHMIFGHLLMRSLIEYYRHPHIQEESE